MKRKEEWDFVKAVLMFIVIYGHICPASSDESYIQDWNRLTRVTGMFVMPLFFLVSGYFQTKITDTSKLKEKIRKISSRIIVPLFAWGTIYLFFRVITIDSPLYYLRYFYEQVARYYWFFTALLQCLLCGSLLSLFIHKNLFWGNSLLVLSVGVFCCMSIDYHHFTFVWGFYVVGMLVSQCENVLKPVLSKKYVVLPFIVLACVIWALGDDFYPSQTFYYTSNLFKDTNVVFVVYRYVLCLTASIVALYWMLFFYSYYKKSRIMIGITITGKDTLFYYCSHLLVLDFAYRPLILHVTCDKGLLPGSPFIRYYVVCVFISLLFYVSLYVCCRLCRKSKICKMLFLGEKN